MPRPKSDIEDSVFHAARSVLSNNADSVIVKELPDSSCVLVSPE